MTSSGTDDKSEGVSRAWVKAYYTHSIRGVLGVLGDGGIRFSGKNVSRERGEGGGEWKQTLETLGGRAI